MAPEVAHGRYGREVDVYSLGIILYEMLTGRVPFDGETTAEILMKHLSEKPDLAPIPERLRPVLARALEKDPQKRTPGVAELEREFNNAVLGIDLPQEIPEHSFARVQNTHKTSSPAAAEQPGCWREPVPPRHRYDGDNRRTIGWSVIALCVFLAVASRAGFPALLGSGMGAVVVVGTLGALGYGGYRLVAMAVAGATAAIGRRRAVRGSPDPALRWAEGLRESRETCGPINGEVGRPAPSATHRDRQQAVIPHPVDYPRHRGYTHGRDVSLTPRSRRSIALRDRATDVTGAMTLAVVCTAILTAGLFSLTSFFPEPGTVGLFAIITSLGSWAILIPSKLCEGTGAEAGLRRLILLAVGCLVGMAAFAVDGSLMVDLPTDELNRPIGLFDRVGSHALLEGTQPTLAGYIVFFGALFGLRRWWWHADAFRPKRFRVLSLLTTVLLAYFVTLVWAFPQGWGMTWAAAISSVVQLSAIWVPGEFRPALMEADQHV
jgi:hypothetical protein